MKFIESSVSEITEIDALKKIEIVGRTCYKSESNITDESAARFVRNLVKNKHYAMLEHAVYTFKIKSTDLRSCIDIDLSNGILPSKFMYISLTADDFSFVSANLRCLLEGEGLLWETLLTLLYRHDKPVASLLFGDYTIIDEYVCDGSIITDINEMPEDIRDTHSFKTFRFITDRGVSHELVRHRVSSFAQESTRYCNYSKEKFGAELTFIRPAEYHIKPYGNMYKLCEMSEMTYMDMLQCGSTPQTARGILPNCIKTEIVVTTNEEEWHHIGDLRLRGTTGKPHPNMEAIMKKLSEIYPEL